MFKLLITAYVRETIIGILIGIPIIAYIAKSNIRLPMNHFIGDLSYGLFLSHFLAIWVVKYYSLVDKHSNAYLYVIVVFVFSLMTAILGVLSVELNIKKYRYHLSSSIKKQPNNANALV